MRGTSGVLFLEPFHYVELDWTHQVKTSDCIVEIFRIYSEIYLSCSRLNYTSYADLYLNIWYFMFLTAH